MLFLVRATIGLFICLIVPDSGITGQDTSSGGVSIRERMRMLVLNQNPVIAARRAQVLAERANLVTAGTAAPVLLEAEIEEVPDGVDVLNAGSLRLGLTKQLMTGGSRNAHRASAEARVAAALADLHLAERQVAARVDQLFTRLMATASVTSLLGTEDSLLSEVEQALRSRFAVGEARYVDVLRLRTERLRVRSERAWSVTDQQVDHNALVAMAIPGTAAEDVRRLLDSTLAENAIDDLFPEAPGVDSLWQLSGFAAMANATIASAEASAQQRRAGVRPEWAAGLGVQRFGDKVGGYQVGPTLGFSVSLPFLQTRSQQANLAAAELSVAAVRQESEAVAAETRNRLSAARDRYESARAQLQEFAAVMVIGAQEERESALSAYRSGDISLLELLDFQRALTRSEILRLRSRIIAADAYAEMMGVSPDGAPATSALLTITEGVE